MRDDRNSQATGIQWANVVPMLLVCAILVGVYAISMFPGRYCGTFALYSSTYMRYMDQVIREHYERDEELPPELSLILTNFLTSADERSAWTIPRCSPQRPSDVLIGDYTLDDWLEGRVTREALWASAARSPQSGTWRNVGHYVFCVDADTLAGYSEHAIVGFETMPHRRAIDPNFNVLFANGLVTNHLDHQLPALAEAHDGPPLPESFYALFNNTTR